MLSKIDAFCDFNGRICEAPNLSLAGLILDSLDIKKFACSWRRAMNNNSALYTEVQENVSPCTERFAPQIFGKGDNGNCRPEIVILAALVLSHKTVSDNHIRTSSYAEHWGGGLWTCEQINSAERSILETLDFNLQPLCKADLLREQEERMQISGSWDLTNDMGEMQELVDMIAVEIPGVTISAEYWTSILNLKL
jgi:hypothetical protein